MTPKSKPALSPEERVSSPLSYPQHTLPDEELSQPIRIEEQDAAWAEPDYKDLDSEGRALVLDFGLFVLINVYCPNDGNGTEERDRYKADFHRVLRARIRGLVEREGREVVLVGDINACAAVMDHCEGHLMVAKGLAKGMSDEEGFWGKDVRRWLRNLMVDEEREGTRMKGYVVDIVRRLHPDRKGMYTCTFGVCVSDSFFHLLIIPFFFFFRTGWDTKISARDSNYGTRIDYILITPGLLPWVKGADIQPQIKGSDHCPVYLDLLDEIPDPNREGVSIKLRDVLDVKPSIDGRREPPKLASKFWPEYSGKQMLLSKFFGKKNVDDTMGPSPSTNANINPNTPPIFPLPEVSPSEPVVPSAWNVSDPRADLQLPPDASQGSASSSSSFTTIPTDSLPPTPTQTNTASRAQRETEPQLPPNASQSPSHKLTPSSSSSLLKTASTSSNLTSTPKRKLTAETSSLKRQKQEQKMQGQGPGQIKLLTVFGKPPPSPSLSSKRRSKFKPKSRSKSILQEPDPDAETQAEPATASYAANTNEGLDADDRFAMLSQEQEQILDLSCSQGNGNGNENKNENGSSTSKHIWSTLLAPTQVPKCTVHGEPAKELTVTKQGPNRGKRFFICAR